MRGALVAVAIALSAPAGANADTGRDAVAALPVLAELDGATPVIVRGDLAPRQARAALRELRGVHADVTRRFVSAGPPRPPVTLCLFATDDAYARFAARVFGGSTSRLGFYRPDRRVAVANLARGVGNARHELVHPLLADDFAGIPPWLDEGMAALYGSAAVGGRRAEFRVNYRLRDLHAAMRAGTLPSLDDLAAARAAGFYDDDKATRYALARYALLFLDRRGRLEAFYRAMRAAGGVEGQRRVLRAHVDEAAFLAWARRLSTPSPPPRARSPARR